MWRYLSTCFCSTTETLLLEFKVSSSSEITIELLSKKKNSHWKRHIRFPFHNYQGIFSCLKLLRTNHASCTDVWCTKHTYSKVLLLEINISLSSLPKLDEFDERLIVMLVTFMTIFGWPELLVAAVALPLPLLESSWVWPAVLLVQLAPTPVLVPGLFILSLLGSSLVFSSLSSITMDSLLGMTRFPPLAICLFPLFEVSSTF